MAEIGGEPRGGPQRGRREGARPSAKGTKPSLDDDPTQMLRDEDLGGRPTKTRAREGKNKKKREKKKVGGFDMTWRDGSQRAIRNPSIHTCLVHTSVVGARRRPEFLRCQLSWLF